ncbi:MAG: hypothetical protein WBD16_07060, partial [Pyrinomonadaceae bacterium]
MRIQSFEVPQADRLETVIHIVINVANGARTDAEIIHNIADLGTTRQGRYYRLAAELLGFITNQSNNAQLTAKGEQFTQNPTLDNPSFIASVLGLEVIQRLLPYIELFPEGLTREQIETYLESIVAIGIGESMIHRRVMTILSWLKTINVITEIDHRYRSINTFTANLPVLEIDNIEQPILPTSGALDEYQIVQERAREAREDVVMYRNDALHDRARVSHRHLINLTAERITAAGGIPKSNDLIDLAVNLDSDFIFEMKSTTDTNVRSQVRKGISQLYEYRYLQNKPEANLVLVVESPIVAPNNWMN